MMTSTALPDIGLWFERYGTSVRGVARRVTGNPDDADDALQDAFLAAWRARGRFDASRDPLPWLAMIARRKAVTIVALRSRPVPPPPVQSAPSAEDEVVLNEAESWTRAVVRDEPALALHALAGLPARIVGERLGLPMRTAASRIARARRRLETGFRPATTPAPARSKRP